MEREVMIIPFENRKLLAIEYAKKLNNFIDCDAIQDAIEHVEKADDRLGLIVALEYLDSAINFRRFDTYIRKIAQEVSSFKLGYTDKGEPEYGKQYALTGKTGAKCISNGNSWAESEVR